jgi:hypothetical protein
MCFTMAVTEVRAFPVNATIVMRSALFALANQGATLQVYNEESGIIVATVTRWLGLQKKEVVARVRSLENTCQLELDAPMLKKHESFCSLSLLMFATVLVFRQMQLFNGLTCNASKPVKPSVENYLIGPGIS